MSDFSNDLLICAEVKKQDRLLRLGFFSADFKKSITLTTTTTENPKNLQGKMLVTVYTKRIQNINCFRGDLIECIEVWTLG